MLLIIYICNMDIQDKTGVKVMMLVSTQLFLESHDDLKGTTDYSKRLKFTAKEFKKELGKSLKSEVDLIFEKDSKLTNDIIGDIIKDVDNYVNNLLKSIKQ